MDKNKEFEEAFQKADKFIESELTELRKKYNNEEELTNSKEFDELSKKAAQMVLPRPSKAEKIYYDSLLKRRGFSFNRGRKIPNSSAYAIIAIFIILIFYHGCVKSA